MNWFPIQIADLSSARFAEAGEDELGAWLRLVAHCAQQENGGRILSARCLSPAGMMRTLGVDAATLDRESPRLWQWDGDDLLVEAYPADQEEKCRVMRDRASSGGKARAQAYAKANAQACQSAEKSREEENGGEESNGARTLDFVSERERTVDEVRDRITRLRPAWGRLPGLTPIELHALTANLSNFQALTDDDWARLAAYLQATVPRGAGYWQPTSRERFIESLPDVLGHADRWAEKRGRRVPSHVTTALAPGVK